MGDMTQLRNEFVKMLTVDSETSDRRRGEFNRAIFFHLSGCAIFSDTSLEMVMDKFDRAVKNLTRGTK